MELIVNPRPLIATLMILFLVAIHSTNSQTVPQLILYTESNWTGSSLNLTAEYVSNLTDREFDNVAQSLCAVGTWLFYDLPYFNEAGQAYMNYLYAPISTPNYCGQFDYVFSNKTSSVRFVGSPRDVNADTLTLFNQTYFQGQQEYFTDSYGGPSLSGTASSLIITGSSNWTVFDRAGYAGSSWCITPPVGGSPAFIFDTKDYHIPHGTIRSLRKGCAQSSEFFISLKNNVTYGLQPGGYSLE